MSQAATVQTGSTLLDEATGGTFGGGQASFDEQIDHWYPSCQAHLGNGGFWHSCQFTCALKERMGCVSCLVRLVLTVRQLRGLKGQHLLGLTQFGALHSAQTRDLLQRQESVVLEKALHIPVIDVNPELVKLIWGRQVSVQPDGSSCGFAHFLPTRCSEEGKSQGKGFAISDPADEVDPSDQVAPLIVSAYLEHAAIALEEHQKIIGLQQLVVELEERQPRFQTLLVRLERQHTIDAEMPTNIA